MTMLYHTKISDLPNVFGVGEGKAKKFGEAFVEFIAKYVEENDITPPDEMVIRGVADKSTHKVYIIQSVDRKMDLEDMVDGTNLTMDDFIYRMTSIHI